MRAARRICILISPTHEPTEDEEDQKDTPRMISQEVVDQRISEIDDLCRSPGQESVRSTDQTQTSCDVQDPNIALSGQHRNEPHVQTQKEQAIGDNESIVPQIVQGKDPTHVQSNDGNQQHEQETDRTRIWLAKTDDNYRDDDVPIAPTIFRTMLKELQEKGLNKHTPRASQKEVTEPVSEIKRDNALQAILQLIEPAPKAAKTMGTKRQKYSLLRHLAMFCASYDLHIQAFGNHTKENG